MTLDLALTRRLALLGVGGGLLTACSRRRGAAASSAVVLREATYRGQPDSVFAQAGLSAPSYRVATAQFAGGNLIAEAINARALDIGGMSEIPPIFVADVSGNLVRIIAALQGDVNSQVVLVPKGSAIRDIGDLKTKRIGYVRATTSHYILLRILEEAGLSWKDVTAVALSPQDGLAAFQQGSLDAWVIYGVIIYQARAAGARVLTTGKGRLSGNYLVAASAEAIADAGKSAAIADYLQRYRKVIAWINADPDRWASLRAAATGTSVAYYRQETAEQSAPYALSPVSDAAIASQQAVANAFAKAGVILNPVNVSPLWDRRFAAVLAA